MNAESWKIFVTSWIYPLAQQAAAISTQVIGFETRNEAERAMQVINDSSEIPYMHKAIPLYK